MATWITRNPHPDEKQREAVQGEFFAAESIVNEAQALIREGIQNSLDAAEKDPVTKKKKTRVRIYVSGSTGALPWDKTSQFFEAAWPHYEAKNSGLLESERPQKGAVCPFLVFEDFGTSGLTGDVNQITKPKNGESNAFYYYLRAEGQFGKSDSDRGRWGIGKFVFPKASRIRSFLAVTNRSDDGKAYVTGQFILKWHTVQEKQYSPDGWFGIRSSDGVLLPSDESELVNNVKSTFRLARETEPGLSLIVPWCRADINRALLIESALRDFYFPILNGELVVEVADPKGSEIIDSQTFSEVFSLHEGGLSSDEVGTIRLAQAAAEARGLVAFNAEAHPTKEPIWLDELVSEETVTNMSHLLNDGGLVSIRVPIWVHKTMGAPERSEVRVWMRRDDSATAGKPVFVREGLVIPAAHSTLSRGFRSIVLIEDPPIARLLGDAENPSHTKWDAKSEHFQGKYPASKGASTITFVRTVVRNLVNTVTKVTGEKDFTTFANEFKAPPSGQGRNVRQPRAGRRTRTRPPFPPVERPKKLWSSNKISGGFSVYGSGEPFQGSKKLTIKMGYDVVRGNPVNRWSPYDFKLDDGKGIEISSSGAGIVPGSVTRTENRYSVEVSSEDFRIEFRGFDEHRDIFMDARMKDAD